MIRCMAARRLLVVSTWLAVFWLLASSRSWGQPSASVAEQAEGSDGEIQAKLKPPAGKDTRSLRSAAEMLRTFLLAMEREDYGTAITAMDFSTLDPAPDAFTQVRFAQRLKECFARLPLVDASEIGDGGEGSVMPFPPDDPESPIVLRRGADGNWRFAAETVARIDAIAKILEERAPPASEPADDAPSEDEKRPDEPIANETPKVEAKEPADDDKNVEPRAKDKLAAVPDQLASARRTMKTLFDSFDDKTYDSAVATLDLSEFDQQQPAPGPYVLLSYARRLKEIIERMAVIDYAEISDDPNGPTFNFPPDKSNQPIVIRRCDDGAWRFSSDTVGRIDALHEIYKTRPILNLPEDKKPWYLRELVLGNETWRIIALFVAIFASLLVGQLLRGLLNWRANALERKQRHLRSMAFRSISKTALGVFFLIGLKSGISVLVLEHDMARLVSSVLHVIFACVIGYVCFRLVDVAVELLREITRRTGSTLNHMLVPIVRASLRLTIVVLVLLEIATAISDQPPSAVLAGLGAGGLAIGLAAQETIKNLFGSVMIFADRPFELGDRIVFDGHDGPVETVGFRSTRIRTLDGHLVTVPNGEMANKAIHNIGKRPFIRRVMNIHIAYDSPPEKLRRALAILRELLDNHEGKKDEYPARVFLHDFLDTAINIQAIYWYHPPDYWKFCDFGERLNLQIVEEFQAAGIRFALPSQRVFLAGDQQPPEPAADG